MRVDPSLYGKGQPPIDQRRLSPAVLPWHLDGSAVEVRVRLVLRQPVRKRQRRITQPPPRPSSNARTTTKRAGRACRSPRERLRRTSHALAGRNRSGKRRRLAGSRRVGVQNSVPPANSPFLGARAAPHTRRTGDAAGLT